MSRKEHFNEAYLCRRGNGAQKLDPEVSAVGDVSGGGATRGVTSGYLNG